MTFSVTWPGWWFLNGHLFRDGEAVSRNGKVRWKCWTCIFCGKHPHTIGGQDGS